MFGPQILVRSLSSQTIEDKHGNLWSYHSRSDRHSKIACWGITFDLLQACPLLRSHILDNKVAFGINHEMRDFQHDRKKNLDLVFCTPGSGTRANAQSFAELAGHYGVVLLDEEQKLLATLPALQQAPVGSVLIALESKACMTAHQRALPRLYDELNSSHATVHGSSDHAIAAGLVMINISETFLSPDLNKANLATAPELSTHVQPQSAEITVQKVKQLPRRASVGTHGFDALSIVIVNAANDGTPVTLHEDKPAPASGEIHHYDAMIERMANLYATRFGNL